MIEWRTAIDVDSSLNDPAYISNTNGLLLYDKNHSLIDCRPNEPKHYIAMTDMTQASINDLWYDKYGQFTIKIISVHHSDEVIKFSVTMN
mgnify:FL=1